MAAGAKARRCVGARWFLLLLEVLVLVQSLMRSNMVSAAPAEHRAVLVTMCNFKYFPGAANVLHSARVNGWTGELMVIVDASVPRCARDILTHIGATVVPLSKQWVGMRYGSNKQTTVHFGKLDLLTDPLFRRFDDILYMDADMQAVTNPEAILALAPTQPAAFVRVGNPEVRFYRESAKSVPLELQQRFPDRARVYSTRLMLFHTRLLPDVATMQSTVHELLVSATDYFDAMFEQGLLQLLFYDTVGDVPAAWLNDRVLHFYSQSLPWVPGSPHFAKFAVTYESMTSDVACLRNATHAPTA
ncbi:uncharacterized protein MONBRDRAFT_25658 [Monosiga brevicollis MX1]|uniref:Nucleotide-diphospho-sugar transferase domain-containing protein n=1 Tax=Monosiga brevicollis TaxID=81824 RepID=A9V017_MONBE|nr:uncharacterized protein MONBRDRAFT_25658 [Monosiga brevicollis MX1]EDQ89078.1 predicted protein [Monosiga brevicollis MX1]|eukprot:XP_001746183.1 hypothetical protein [Monosiga brevicollis MX1]